MTWLKNYDKNMIEHQIDFALEARRQLYIEKLYERAGRSCGTYSGLLIQHIDHLLEQDMAKVLDGDSADA